MKPVPGRRSSVAWAVALAVALAPSLHAARGQQSAPSSSPPPLEAFTVTYRTQEFGAGMGPALEMVVQSDGTAHLNDAPDGRTPIRSIDVHLPASELTTLAQRLVDPAFVHEPSTPAAGEGRFTTVDVRSPRMTHHVVFYETPPPAAAPVLTELARLRMLVSRRVLAEQSTRRACRADADCRLAACDCRCVAAIRSDTSFHCSPGHCAAQPCRSGETAACDSTTHRCVVRPSHAP